MKSKTDLALGFSLGLVVLVLLSIFRISDPTLIRTLRETSFDLMQRAWPRPDNAAAQVRIVDIDEKSLAKLGQWPWPRDTLAKLVVELTELGAAAIAFDILFPEADRSSLSRLGSDEKLKSILEAQNIALTNNDEIFAKGLGASPSIIAFADGALETQTSLIAKAGFVQIGDLSKAPLPQLRAVTMSLPLLTNAAPGLGSINIDIAGEQGVVRRIPLVWRARERFFPALSLEAVRIATGSDTIILEEDKSLPGDLGSIRVGELRIPVSSDGTYRLHFAQNQKNRYVSAVDLIEASAREKLRPLIEGHIIFIGTSATGLLDSRVSPLGETVPGVSIHAQAAEQFLEGQSLSRPDWIEEAEITSVLVIGLLLVLGVNLGPPLFATAIIGSLAMLATGIAFLLFRNSGLLVDLTYPLMALASTLLVSTGYKLLFTDRRGRQLKAAFAQYVAPTVLAEIERNPTALKLGGQNKEITVMFVDIANFTPMSERCSPEELLGLTNRVLDAASSAILAHEGTLDKYIGDAVMAFWNAPTEIKDHQTAALRAALDIRSKIVALNADETVIRLLAEKQLDSLSVRVGIASGTAIVGNIGTSARFDYSALGETVNRAARAEGVGKDLGFDIILCEPIAEAARKFALLPAGQVIFKGLTGQQSVWCVVGDAAVAASPEFIKLVEVATTSQDAPEELLGQVSRQCPSLAPYFARRSRARGSHLVH